MIKQLEIGEHVDLDTGLMVKRISENEYKLKAPGETIILQEGEIETVAELSGYSIRKLSDIDVW